MIAYLVRHAHAGDRERWEGPDQDRPLTDKGRRQAERLAQRLAPSRPARLLSSPYLRCRQTLEPLGLALALPVLDEPDLAEGRPPDLALELIRQATADIALCSHGDVIGGIVENLWRRRLVRAPRWEKGSTWALEVHAGEIVGATYIEP
ncbi:MAG TPA: phosphoglycerate mutase family protein [Candidatus Dormibacteraeota bacterium]|jgi:8-oxo-dGTP diphosphatase|nr:phosphoglycerate mutase family protein [Candidatus Dormibacteraeota bacterium]